MRGESRGILLFASELMMLRRAGQPGGSISLSEAVGCWCWNSSAELCRLGLLAREGADLVVTPDGEKALRLTAGVPDGQVGFISMGRWVKA
jgi:hypothetical protein